MEKYCPKDSKKYKTISVGGLRAEQFAIKIDRFYREKHPIFEGGKIALAVASSGIAATLLEGGKTAHSTFKLPLNPERSDKPVCNISKNTPLAEILQKCTLIVWDECTMTHKANLEAVNRTLKDLKDPNCVMGGVTFVMAGDFRQTLPIVDRGTRANEIDACIKSSTLWSKVQRKFKLTTNMRVHLKQAADPIAAESFSKNF